MAGGISSTIENTGNINSLGGVDITSPTNGQVLTYNSFTQLWVNANGGGGGSGYQTIEGQGTPVAQETALNFATGCFSVVDNPGSMRTDVSISATGLTYTPAISGNWSTPPATVAVALDDIAATGITGTFTAGSVLFSNGTKVTQDNTRFFWDDTGYALKLRTGSTYQFGTQDAFSRYQIWNFETNAILRLGSLGADGDPTTTSSEGIVVYGPAVNGSMAPGNWGIGRVKVDRLGLLSNVPGGLQDYYFRADPNGMFLQSDASVKTFNVDRNTGTITTSLGAGFVVSNGSGVLSVNTSVVPWIDQTATSVTMTAGTGYFADNAGLVTLTLPATVSLGATFEVSALGAGGWLIAQNAGQSIRFGIDTTTVGVGGSLASTQTGDSVKLVCSVANTTFQVVSAVGNIAIT